MKSRRRRRRRRLLLRLCPLLLVFLVVVCVAQKDADVCEENGVGTNSNSSHSCGVYLAPSTIPNAGLGVFSTHPLQEGSTVPLTGDLCIPIVDLKWHNAHADIFWPIADYVWVGRSMGMSQEAVGKNGIDALCVGAMDCAVNCNLALINVGKARPDWDSAHLSLFNNNDPGAGAITPYHNGTTTVEANIPAGGELFKFYGNKWFKTRTDVFGLIPLRENFTTVEELVVDLTSLEVPKTVQEGFWKIVVEHIPWESRVTNALPLWKDIPVVQKEGIRALYQPLATRNISFLQEYGRCMDNIVNGPSTLPQAGRGAFASRFLPRKSIVTGSPLLVILERDYLHMYHAKYTKKGRQVRDTTRWMGHQLLLNYCYGHQDSNMLLVPYASGVNYINHNQTLANVRIQWAPDGIISHNASYLELDINAIKERSKTIVAVDYIALRDIRPGEELFLDYGDAFEQAWTNHVQDWKRRPNKSYVDAHTFNGKMRDSILRTQDEQEIDPYPTNLVLFCHPNLKKKDWHQADFVWSLDKKGVKCNVSSRTRLENGEFVYLVTLQDDGARDGVPRGAIQFVDKPYTTDFHQPGTFRHEIGIPNDMFPNQWKNRIAEDDNDGEDE